MTVQDTTTELLDLIAQEIGLRSDHERRIIANHVVSAMQRYLPRKEQVKTSDNDCKSCHFWDRNKHVAYTRHGTEILAACLNPEAPWVGMDCNGGCKFWTKRGLQKTDVTPNLLHADLCEACRERNSMAWNQRVAVKLSEPRTID